LPLLGTQKMKDIHGRREDKNDALVKNVKSAKNDHTTSSQPTTATNGDG